MHQRAPWFKEQCSKSDLQRDPSPERSWLERCARLNACLPHHKLMVLVPLKLNPDIPPPFSNAHLRHSGNLWSFETVVKPSFQEHCTKTCPAQWSMSRAEVVWAPRTSVNLWVNHRSCTMGTCPIRQDRLNYCQGKKLGLLGTKS